MVRRPVFFVCGSLESRQMARMLLTWSVAWLIVASVSADASPPSLSTPADRMVSDIAFRLGSAGRPRCGLTQWSAGVTLRHLGQYQPADRPMAAAAGLDRGPVVLAAAAGGPAEAAGVRPGDVLLSVGGVLLPPDDGAALPFDAARARKRTDALLALVEGGGESGVGLGLLREGRPVAAIVRPAQVCRSIVHLARSDQRNAYADGTHVFITTRLVAEARDQDEVAFLIAHEMAHNALGHAEAMKAAGVRRGLGRTLGRSGAAVRAAERAADRLGAELMLDAGYDPVAGAEILRRLRGPELGLAFLAAHDNISARIAAIRTVAGARSGAPALSGSPAR